MNKKQAKTMQEVKDVIEMKYMLLELERVNPGKNIYNKTMAAWLNTEYGLLVNKLTREEDEE